MAEDVPGPGQDPGTPSATPESPDVSGGRRRRRLVGALATAGVVLVATGVVTVAGWLPEPAGEGESGGPGGPAAPTRTGLAELPGAPGAAPPGRLAPSGGATSVPPGSGRPGSRGAPPAGASGTPLLPPHLTPAPAGPTGPTTFAGLAGPGCTGGAGATAVTGGWERSTGGWTHDGCDGSVLTHTTTAVGTDSVTWRFDVPVAGTCAVEVYVPTGADAAEALYDVVAGGDVGGFTVDQRGNPGRWVAAGNFHAAAGPFAVRLTDRGDGRSGVAAAALRLRCH